MNTKLTRARVIEIVGPLDESLIAQVLDAEATPAELEMARVLAEKQDTSDLTGPSVRTPVVHRLYDILRAELPERDA